MPSKTVAWVEGEAKAKDIIYDLATKIDGATWKDLDGTTPVVNRWTEVYRQDPDIWVTYKEMARTNVAGIYRHTTGLNYPVYIIAAAMLTYQDAVPDASGFITERTSTRKLKVDGTVTYTDVDGATVTQNVQGMLMVNLPDGVRIVKQRRKNLDNTFSDLLDWNEFQVVADVPAEMGDYLAYFTNGGLKFDRSSWGDPANAAPIAYKFTERYYTADPVHFYEKTVVLKSIPDNTDGTASTDSYYVMFKHPKDQYNYFDVYYGKGFVGTNMTGDAQESYIRSCAVATVKPTLVPTITNQKEAEAAYLRSLGVGFVTPSDKWDIDLDGVTEIKSPPAHYHYGADSVITWLTYKKRREDYFVSYWISISNNRIAMVIEGDPSPDHDGYYRSFGYFGRITPFNDTDQTNNFAVTVGMGDVVDGKTGMTKKDISQDTNPVYSGFGRYTSNGMYSVSMMGSRSSVMFQAHYPAFITELPNYPSVGTIPPELSKLITETNGFQASSWTSKYHGSPIYLAHQYEGYRGYMDSAIAINDHNLINLDELVVDTEETKPGGGTYQEIYKFFSLNAPVSFFDYSANPNGMTIAILKEVK